MTGARVGNGGPRAVAIVGLACLTGVIGAATACQGKPTAATTGADAEGASRPGASASASAVGSVSTSGTVSASTVKPRLPCRAVSLTGQVAVLPASAAIATPVDGGAPLLYPTADIPRGAWLALPAGGRLTAKDPRSTRETTFLGPARVKACVDDEEESWLTSGTFESAPGAGETLGAEEWVVTPVGAFRYAAAGLTIAVAGDSATLRIDKGTAFVALAADARASLRDVDGGPPRALSSVDAGLAAPGSVDAWLRVDAPASLRLSVPPINSPRGRASASIHACVESMKQERGLRRQLAENDAAVGELTPRHVTARRAMRAACAIAEVRAEALAPEKDDDRSDKLRQVSANWRADALKP